MQYNPLAECAIFFVIANQLNGGYSTKNIAQSTHGSSTKSIDWSSGEPYTKNIADPLVGLIPKNIARSSGESNTKKYSLIHWWA